MGGNLESIDYFSKDHPLRGMATRVAFRARVNMYNFFEQKLQPTPEAKIIDVGVTPDQKLIDSNFFEKLYPHKDKITATSIEDAFFLEQVYKGLSFVQTPPDHLPFEDKEFDIAFCSAVLEHVGNREQQRHFISEILRVAKRFFITTPNKGFPIELHTFLPLIHWLPQPQHQAVLRRLGKDFWAKTENLNLVGPDEFLRLFPAGTQVELHKHRLLGIPSNLVAYGSSPK